MPLHHYLGSASSRLWEGSRAGTGADRYDRYKSGYGSTGKGGEGGETGTEKEKEKGGRGKGIVKGSGEHMKDQDGEEALDQRSLNSEIYINSGNGGNGRNSGGKDKDKEGSTVRFDLLAKSSSSAESQSQTRAGNINSEKEMEKEKERERERDEDIRNKQQHRSVSGSATAEGALALAALDLEADLVRMQRVSGVQEKIEGELLEEVNRLRGLVGEQRKTITQLVHGNGPPLTQQNDRGQERGRERYVQMQGPSLSRSLGSLGHSMSALSQSSPRSLMSSPRHANARSASLGLPRTSISCSPGGSLCGASVSGASMGMHSVRSAAQKFDYNIKFVHTSRNKQPPVKAHRYAFVGNSKLPSPEQRPWSTRGKIRAQDGSFGFWGTNNGRNQSLDCIGWNNRYHTKYKQKISSPKHSTMDSDRKKTFFDPALSQTITGVRVRTASEDRRQEWSSENGHKIRPKQRSRTLSPTGSSVHHPQSWRHNALNSAKATVPDLFQTETDMLLDNFYFDRFDDNNNSSNNKNKKSSSLSFSAVNSSVTPLEWANSTRERRLEEALQRDISPASCGHNVGRSKKCVACASEGALPSPPRLSGDSGYVGGVEGVGGEESWDRVMHEIDAALSPQNLRDDYRRSQAI